jgi:hypothetical protein
VQPSFYVKIATRQAAQESRLYGWNEWRTIPNPSLRRSDAPIRYQPGPPPWRKVDVRRRADGRVQIDLAWRPAADVDGDLVEYRVSVGLRSRAWQLDRLVSDRSVARYVRGLGWRPREYEALVRPLPDEVGRFRSRQRPCA